MQATFANRELLLFIVISFLLGFLGYHFKSSLFVKNGNDSNMNLISVDKGDKLELSLADGTKVVLNSASELQFPNSFSGCKSRIVKLIGEAYFEVSKNSVPFIVKTERGNIIALGTKFNISAYENESFKTTLINGTIKFKENQVEKVLIPGQQLIIDHRHRILMRNVNVETSIQWKEGIISFSHEKLGDVIKKLERYYDVTVDLDKDLASIKFTGELQEESIKDVLNLINITIPITYDYNSKLKYITIKSRK